MKVFRHELKYVCSEAELSVIQSRIQHLMQLDSHADQNGQYLIRSLYFDDYMRSCFYDNEDGADPREKYRIRAYNYSRDYIFLEKKKKVRGMTAKQSCRISEKLFWRMIRGDRLLDQLGRDALLDEWIIDRNRKLIHPVMLGEYVRKPFVYKLGNVRITFDQDISAISDPRLFFEGSVARFSVLPTGTHVLEVKYDDFLPDTIYRLIDNGHLQQQAFSKFYLGCKALRGVVNEF